MLLWVGLGNPGRDHARSRHNIGFLALDRLAGACGFSPWRNRFGGECAEGQIGGARIFLLKPLTWMNLSGEAVQPAAAFFKIPPERITVFHDELDLAAGRVRVKRGGGNAGHNGLRSIQMRLGTADFWRVRLGIGHPGAREAVLGHVLGNFEPADGAWLAAMLDALVAAAADLAQNRAEEFMTKVALAAREPG